MKHSVATGCLLIFILLIISWPVFSQDTQQVPNLSLKEGEFDFGKVKEGSRISHDFTVLNQGEAVLEIKKVSPD